MLNTPHPGYTLYTTGTVPTTNQIRKYSTFVCNTCAKTGNIGACGRKCNTVWIYYGSGTRNHRFDFVTGEYLGKYCTTTGKRLA